MAGFVKLRDGGNVGEGDQFSRPVGHSSGSEDADSR